MIELFLNVELMSESKLKKPSKRAQHTRKRILDAAMAILDEEGIANLTVAKIVKRASVANGSYLHQFETKEDLLVCLIELYHQEKTNALEAKFDGFAIRSRNDVDYFLSSLQEIQIGYFRHVSNEFFVSQRANTEITKHIKSITDGNRERSHGLYRSVFGEAFDENPKIAEIIDDYVNVFLRGIAVITPNRSAENIHSKVATWKSVFAGLINDELQL